PPLPRVGRIGYPAINTATVHDDGRKINYISMAIQPEYKSEILVASDENSLLNTDAVKPAWRRGSRIVGCDHSAAASDGVKQCPSGRAQTVFVFEAVGQSVGRGKGKAGGVATETHVGDPRRGNLDHGYVEHAGVGRAGVRHRADHGVRAHCEH